MIGNGHFSPALALSDYINNNYSRKYKAKVVDLAKELNAHFFYRSYSESWKYVGLRKPLLATAFFNLGDNRFISWLVNGFFGMGLKKRLKAFLEKEKPDIFVTTHYFFAHRFGALKKNGKSAIPHISINTDPFFGHHFWADRCCDAMVVFSKEAKSQLKERGVSSAQIHVFPYPINPKFEIIKYYPREIKKELGLRQDTLTFSMSAGGEGIGIMHDHIKFLQRKKLDIQFVVMCGRNKELKFKLEQEVKGFAGPPYIYVKGFVHNIEKYLIASDFMVGKAGANFTFEALRLGKPVIHNAWVHNEIGTKDFVVDNGFGFAADTPWDLHSLILKIVKDKRILNECKKRIAGHKIINGTAQLSDFIINQVK